MAAELGQFIQEKHAIVGQRHVARHRHVAPPISPASEIVWWGARNGRVVTNAVRSPVSPATRWMRVVSIASGRGIAGSIVVSRRASIDLPAPESARIPFRRSFRRETDVGPSLAAGLFQHSGKDRS
jgi:hypothetical protein